MTIQYIIDEALSTTNQQTIDSLLSMLINELDNKEIDHDNIYDAIEIVEEHLFNTIYEDDE